jgi:hypothetical protein
MASFDEFIKGYTFNPETLDIETFKSDVEKAHNDDLGIREAKIQQQTEAISKLETENLALKGKNYDLLMKIPARNPSETGGSGNEDKPIDVDDFFHD